MNEGIVAKSGGSYKPPPEGRFNAVCCDVVDLGMVETTWNGQTKRQHKISVVFQINRMMEAAKDRPARRYTVSERFTLSLHEKAKLRGFLESWRGKKYTPMQAEQGIDVEKMIGVNAEIQVVHNERNGTTYANIQSIMMPRESDERLEVLDYVRVKDREERKPPRREGPPIGDPPEWVSDEDEEDDDLPF